LLIFTEYLLTWNQKLEGKIMKRSLLMIFIYAITINCFNQPSHTGTSRTFTNPLFPSGADPWIVRHNEYYYYCSSAENGIIIRRGKDINELRMSQPVRIWTAPEGTMWSREIWAPELHYLDGKWYIYFAADDGNNRNHRMYVIENPSAEPLSGSWTFRGKVSDKTDRWAIDGTPLRYRRKLYLVWSGWEGEANGQQNLYIAEMANPWTVSGERSLLSEPEFVWERVGDLNNPEDVPHVNVNEGPAALVRNKRLFIVYSASGCWTDSYCLGMLTFTGRRNLLDTASWEKSREPVFRSKPEAGVYAPGHNSFFKSPDGREDWIVYHANPSEGQGCGRHRSPRAQKFSWNPSGIPDFGEPVQTGMPTEEPSGDPTKCRGKRLRADNIRSR
jgi:GH43 family beta-xylosidase